MRHAGLWLLALALIVAPTLAWAEDPPEDEAEAIELEWLDDYDAARQKAQDDGKGLFVYLTPDWFR